MLGVVWSDTVVQVPSDPVQQGRSAFLSQLRLSGRLLAPPVVRGVHQRIQEAISRRANAMLSGWSRIFACKNKCLRKNVHLTFFALILGRGGEIVAAVLHRCLLCPSRRS